MNDGFVLLKQQTLQELLNNFYSVCSLCDELNIYEWKDGDESMQEMKSWAEEKFGRKIEKEHYD
jgi:hypothetical protein